MAKEKVYKTPIRASQFVKALKEKKVSAQIINDENCYPVIAHARIDTNPGARCHVTYWVTNPEEYLDPGDTAGEYTFKLLGVVYTGSRGFDSESDFEEESLSGREIKYDINPETDEVYTEEELFEIIHEEVDFKSYDSFDYEMKWTKDTYKDIEDHVELPDESLGQYFALDEVKDVYLFDEDEPMPRGEGFRRISAEAAIHRIVVINKDVYEGFY